MIDPAALRAIADDLEWAEQLKDQGAAIEQGAMETLRGLLNATSDSEIPTDATSDGIHQAGAVRDDTDAGPTRPESAGSTPAPRSTQVPEAPSVAKPAAVGLPPGVASGTNSSRVQKRSFKQRLEDRQKVPCPHCAARMLPRGLPIHLAKSLRKGDILREHYVYRPQLEHAAQGDLGLLRVCEGTGRFVVPS